MSLKRIFACFLLLAIVVPAGFVQAAAYTPYRGQSIAIGKQSLSPATVNVTLADLRSISAQQFGISIFGNDYKVNVAGAQFRNPSNVPTTLQAFTIGKRVNVIGTLDATDTTLIHAQIVRDTGITGDGAPPDDDGDGDSEQPPLAPIGPPPGAVYATAPASFSKSGVFLQAPLQSSAPAGSARAEFKLPVEPGKNYRSIKADFDVRIPAFPGLAFNGVVVDLTRPNKDRDPLKRGYMSSWITLRNKESRGIRTIIDTLDNRFKATQGAWAANATYHVQVVYNMQPATTVMTILNRDTGQALQSASSPVSNTDIRDIGQGIYIGFGLGGVADGGGYFPPYGWTFSNLEVTVAPVAAINTPVGGNPPGNPTSTPPVPTSTPPTSNPTSTTPTNPNSSRARNLLQDLFDLRKNTKAAGFSKNPIDKPKIILNLVKMQKTIIDLFIEIKPFESNSTIATNMALLQPAFNGFNLAGIACTLPGAYIPFVKVSDGCKRGLETTGVPLNAVLVKLWDALPPPTPGGGDGGGGTGGGDESVGPFDGGGGGIDDGGPYFE